MSEKMNLRPMLNAYPDSIGGTLGDIAEFLRSPEVEGAFSSFYILPSLYHTDLDRGFSVQDYDLEETLATKEDLDALREAGIDLKLDFILNHASVLSPQFQDMIRRGDESPYRDFFIDWNRFWEGHGQMTAEGYIQPDESEIRNMFFRKPGLPLLMVRFPDGTDRPYWNTFYQKVWEEDGERKYLGQMDLNLNSSLVWEFYAETLKKIAGYGAKIVRLDAFAYAPKAPGRRNFLNEPETWEVLDRVAGMAAKEGLVCLPEIHASYGEGMYAVLAEKGYMTYDFFLPGLIVDALDRGRADLLVRWGQEIIDRKIRTVNMLGCHDGIPVLDLKGLMDDRRIEEVIDLTVSRGGKVKNLHGAKNMYYQVNAAYYSALGEDDASMVLARAIQMFMPGKPQVWYMDLLQGKNDYAAVERAGEGGHKEINRTNYTLVQAKEALAVPAVREQIKLLKTRNTHPAFTEDAEITLGCEGNTLKIRWKNSMGAIALKADLKRKKFEISEG